MAHPVDIHIMGGTRSVISIYNMYKDTKHSYIISIIITPTLVMLNNLPLNLLFLTKVYLKTKKPPNRQKNVRSYRFRDQLATICKC